MATLPTEAPTPPEATPSTSPSRPVVLPFDMEGWLLTEQAAEVMGITRRQFQDLANRYDLPKRKVGLRALYDPQVIEVANQERITRLAAKEAEARQKAADGQGPSALEAGPPVSGAQAKSAEAPPVDRPELLRQALAAIQAQTASVDRIVQNIGRMG